MHIPILAHYDRLTKYSAFFASFKITYDENTVAGILGNVKENKQFPDSTLEIEDRQRQPRKLSKQTSDFGLKNIFLK